MPNVGTVAGLLLPITAVGVVLSLHTAKAASPSYCALYAREYAVDAVKPNAAPDTLQSVQDQAYYRCLNQDEDPPLPRSSAYFATGIGPGTSTASTDKGPPVPLPNARPAPSQDRPVATAAAVAAPPSQATTPKPSVERTIASSSGNAGTTYKTTYHGSGMTPWTAEWKTWCARNFPNSWDPTTGTILNYGANRRELCK